MAQCVMLIAAYRDWKTPYIDQCDGALPRWLRPHAYSIGGELLVNARLRSCVLRIYHVYIGHTVYTRAQVLHVLVESVAVNALLVRPSRSHVASWRTVAAAAVMTRVLRP
jgi:hypothetical protein